MSDPQPTTPMGGNIEILTSRGESFSVPVAAATPEDVPILLRSVFGYGSITSRSPRVRANRTPRGEWTGTDRRGGEVTAVLWEEREFTATEIGQALAAALVAQQRGGI